MQRTKLGRPRELGTRPAALDAGRRRLLGGLAASAVAALLGSRPDRSAAATTKPGGKQRSKRCDGKNWCIDRTQTCGPTGGHGHCFVEAFGDNVCGEVLYQTPDCADCAPDQCVNCRCVLAAGGGDRCNNGANGYDFICVRPL
jgi:hypothetical protein